jgi:hypothetical protein
MGVVSFDEVSASAVSSGSKLGSRRIDWPPVGPIYSIEVKSDIVRIMERQVLGHIEFIMKLGHIS